MEADRSVSVLVLFRHPLFGEGIAHLLRNEPDFVVTSVRTGGDEDAECVTEPAPDVVIVERGDPDRAIDVLRAAPEALVVEVGIGAGPAYAYRREVIESQPDGLVRLIHEVLPSRSPREAVMTGPPLTPLATASGG